MKKFKLVLYILIFSSLSGIQTSNSANINFYLTDFKTEKKGSGYEISCKVNYSAGMKSYFEDSKVALSKEKFRISGIVEKKGVSENDFLYSKLPFDIDGDGKSESAVDIKYIDGSVIINSRKVNRIKSVKKYLNFNIYDFSQKDTSSSFILFDYDKKTGFISFGLNDSNEPVSIENFSNPCLEFSIAREIDSLKNKPAYKIDGLTSYTRYTNETIFSGQEWLAEEVWSAVPVQIGNSGSEMIRVNISNISKPFAVILSLKFSLQEGTTLSTDRLIKIIN